MFRISSFSYFLFFAIGLTIMLLSPFVTNGQQSVKDSTISMHLIMAQYSAQFPGGDVAERFGPNSQVGAGYLYKTNNNWLIGLDGSFMFGSNVKNSEHILDNIETSDDNIVDLEGIYATYHFYERGYSVIGKAGKVFSFNKPNPNSGLMAGIGAGYLQHKIFIDHRDKTAPQITGDYLKGYDELRRGPALNAFAGYLFFGNNKVVNFYAGIDITVAFTQYVHPYSFARMEYNTGNFTDIFSSLKVGWMIPVYKRAPKEFYYY